MAFHPIALALAHPVLAGAALLGTGFVGYEMYSSKHHAKTARTVESGQSYVTSLNIQDGPPPTLLDAHDALRHRGLYPFTVKQDPKDPRKFAAVVGYHGFWRRHMALPFKARFRSRRGHFHTVHFPTNPVPYHAALKTPAGAAAAAQAPLAPAAASGFWRHGRMGRGGEQGNGQRAWHHNWKRHEWALQHRPAPPDDDQEGTPQAPSPPTGRVPSAPTGRY